MGDGRRQEEENKFGGGDKERTGEVKRGGHGRRKETDEGRTTR